jgi:hypothetical protein
MEAVQRRWALAVGALRELAARHRSDDGQAHGESLGGDVDELGDRRLGARGGECVVAELTQKVVRAAAELARDREAGTVVVDTLGDLQVVGMVFREERRAAHWRHQPTPNGRPPVLGERDGRRHACGRTVRR